jgi:hypothetical protein
VNARPFAPSSGRALAARGALRATREQTSHRARNRTDTELRSRPTRTRRRRRAAAADRRRQFFFAESGSGRNDRAAACEVGGDGEVAAPGELSEVRGRRNRTDTAPAGARAGSVWWRRAPRAREEVRKKWLTRCGSFGRGARARRAAPARSLPSITSKRNRPAPRSKARAGFGPPLGAASRARNREKNG